MTDGQTAEQLAEGPWGTPVPPCPQQRPDRPEYCAVGAETDLTQHWTPESLAVVDGLLWETAGGGEGRGIVGLGVQTEQKGKN